MEYWLAEKGSLLIWLLPLSSLATLLFAWMLFQSWRSGVVCSLIMPAAIFYTLWTAGVEDNVSVIEFLGLLAIIIAGGILAAMLNGIPNPNKTKGESND